MGREVVNGGNKETERWSSNLSSLYIDASAKRLPLLSLNHVSFICKSLCQSVKFYEDVLGFVLIKRPSSFNFEGAWLFNHGIGIHLLQVDTTPAKKGVINPKDNHISFQCSNMELIIEKLDEMEIQYVTALVKEGGVEVDQLFFHDPDGYMIEICNCQNLPVLPLSSSCPLRKIPSTTTGNQPQPSSFYQKSTSAKMHLCGEYEAIMMENLMVDMMGISF